MEHFQQCLKYIRKINGILQPYKADFENLADFRKKQTTPPPPPKKKKTQKNNKKQENKKQKNNNKKTKQTIIRYKRLGYMTNIMKQSACLVFNPILVDSYYFHL